MISSLSQFMSFHDEPLIQVLARAFKNRRKKIMKRIAGKLRVKRTLKGIA